MKKKTQIALEFMLILSIVIVIIIGISVYIISYAETFLIKRESKNTKNYFETIDQEVEILNYVEKGYMRKILIPLEMTNIYNVSIQKNYLVFRNNKLNLSFYNVLDTNFSVNISKKSIDSINRTFLTFSKK